MFILKTRLIRSKFDSGVCLRNTEQGGAIYLLLYIDDMLIPCRNIEEIQSLSRCSVVKILGRKIMRNKIEGYIFLTQWSYIEKILESFRLERSKPVQTP